MVAEAHLNPGDFNASLAASTDVRPLSISPIARLGLLVVCCLAQFIDAYNGSSFFAAIPPISFQLGIETDASVWLISAYQLTFASLLLGSGRLTDVFGPKYIFISGLLVMSFCALAAGFVRSEIPLILLRALQGVGAALNIPAAVALIIRLCPDQPAQARMLSIFSSISGIGAIIGLFVGAVLVSDASWPWVLYFTTIFTFILAVAVFVLTPSHLARPAISPSQELGSPKRLFGYGKASLMRFDIVGILALTAALVLFIFAVTSGSIDGWSSARVIAPLVISVVLAGAFALWERLVDEDHAAVPPSMWRYKNFGILTALGLLPVMWWASVQFLFSWLWQQVYGYSTVETAVHFLPLLLVVFIVGPLADILHKTVPLKRIILSGQILLLTGTILLPFANTRDKFWRFVVPGFIIGSSGNLLMFATANVALFTDVPSQKAGVASAIFNCANQLGSAAGAAIIASVQTSVEQSHGGPTSFTGREAGFWFLFAVDAVAMLATFVFMKYVPPARAKAKNMSLEVEADTGIKEEGDHAKSQGSAEI